jgi:hypothetical protein
LGRPKCYTKAHSPIPKSGYFDKLNDRLISVAEPAKRVEAPLKTENFNELLFNFGVCVLLGKICDSVIDFFAESEFFWRIL